jgi:hypothetical protein
MESKERKYLYSDVSFQLPPFTQSTPATVRDHVPAVNVTFISSFPRIHARRGLSSPLCRDAKAVSAGGGSDISSEVAP